MVQSNRIPAEQCQNRALLLLGSNAEDAVQALALARGYLAESTSLLQEGSLWRTAAWGFEGPDFINQVVEVCWEGELDALMTCALEVEKRLGRVRNPTAIGYENRRMDIDVILWSGGQYRSHNLIVPHPRMHLRRFVLQPLAEYWADWEHPVENLRVQELLARCGDENLIHLYSNN
ncbi:MAG: 2-amino-4-hydroxy-6-hydroxymethyldihydropteridine diphosphokinase [Bacteroidota bacterium]